jgi:septation ring formation regulator EzrA
MSDRLSNIFFFGVFFPMSDDPIETDDPLEALLCKCEERIAELRQEHSRLCIAYRTNKEELDKWRALQVSTRQNMSLRDALGTETPTQVCP